MIAMVNIKDQQILLITYFITMNRVFAQEKCADLRQFLCGSGECIPKEYLCDGSRECADGSDETHNLCLHRSCSQSLDYVDHGPDDVFDITALGQGRSFKCLYGACISPNFVCDGIRHCVVDGSDETHAICRNNVCTSQQFRCSYGACIRRQYACDNRIHCHDGSDETEEACKWRNSLCPSRKFKCSYGACIATSKKCNDVFDCLDQSDESEAICGRKPNINFRSSVSYPNIPEDTRITTTKPVQVSDPSSGTKEENRRGCKQTEDPDVYLEILLCGDESNCDGLFVPFGTKMLITCDGAPIPLRCEDDALWYSVRDPSKGPREEPCIENESSEFSGTENRQPPVYPLPSDCGVLPPLSPIPWLVGLFRKGTFSCTGTIIGPNLILTAGHCVIRNQASNRRTVTTNEIKVQVNSPNPNDPAQFASVSLIKLHPQYKGGQTPQYDIALIFLVENLESRYGLSSACLDLTGRILNVPAYTFNRTVGEVFYRWSPFPQNLDPSCVNKASICSRHLNIGDNQFCGTNKESSLYLHRGSSGGPYLITVQESGREKWTVAGIVSNSIHTSECGTPHTVFTSVSKFYDWIIGCGFRGDCAA